MAKIREELRDAAIANFDRNKDGKINREDAELTARVWGQRWPLGVILASLGIGFVFGLVVRGVFA